MLSNEEEQAIRETIEENTMRERIRKFNNINSLINSEVERIEKDVERKRKELEIEAYNLANVEERPYFGRIETQYLERLAFDLAILLERKKFIVKLKDFMGK